MFYATYKGIENSDIAVFHTLSERDAWVDFRDEYSAVMGITRSNTTFERIPMDTSLAENKIKGMLHKKDDYNKAQGWYVVPPYFFA